jgi:predicted regulator of Ras-like GTPase activity (Roadblock/LC7/MglB family)
LKLTKKIDKFQAAVDYLTEYAGVYGAVISDSEGLVIAKSGSDKFDAEFYAALIQVIVKDLNKAVSRLISPEVEYISIKTKNEWLTISQPSKLYLTVAAERKADDLLNVRISRSAEMINTCLAEKYKALRKNKRQAASRTAKDKEGVNV